jgi:hypothetical protein
LGGVSELYRSNKTRFMNQRITAPTPRWVKVSGIAFSPSTRKLILLAHVLSSVGWTGAVASFLALAITGLMSANSVAARAVYIAMEPVTSWVIVPLAIASLVTGLLLSLGTRWGLFRHYWVIFKLLISSFSLPLLFLHTGMIHRVAAAAMIGGIYEADLRQDRIHLVVASFASLGALVGATLLSIYKPKGLAAFGWRRRSATM